MHSIVVTIKLYISVVTSGNCADDPEFDCQQVSALFNLCADVHHAKLKCRKFCGLCTLGK